MVKSKLPTKLEKMLAKNLVDDETQEKLASKIFRSNFQLPTRRLERLLPKKLDSSAKAAQPSQK